jgi:CBS domain-containing protein
MERSVDSDISFAPAPFDELSATERALVRETAVRVELCAGQALLLPMTCPQHLWYLISGHVQHDENAHILVLGAGDTLGWRAMMTECCHVTATALDAVQAWQLPRATALSLLASNPRFSARVFAGMSHQLLEEEDVNHNRELLSLMLVRVRDVPLHPPFYIDGAMDMVSVCRHMSEHRRTSALVHDMQDGCQRIGFFTTTDLRDAMLMPQPLAARDVAHFELITLPPEAELFDALLTMLRHRVHRIIVKQGDEILGVLSQIDLMGFVSNHSHLITLRVDQANNAEDLKVAARQVDETIELLVRGGVRIDIVTRLVSSLNAQIFARLWSLLAPRELVQNSCLLVMGSEGRSEQILKTDQDNALLLRDGYHCDDLQDIVERFSTALLTFGYPPCPGNIMVTNPLWCQPIATFKETIGQWLFGGEADGSMNLAIFLDARAVAGDAGLLQAARAHAMNLASGSDTFIARLASAINQFSEPTNAWWNRLSPLRSRASEVFDLKKLGTFPIVHGARALALEHHHAALSTAERLQTLASHQQLAAELARDLIEALHYLMTLKLRNNLHQVAMGQAVSNLVELNTLSTLERDMLKGTSAVVKQFRQHLCQHYRLEY